MVQVNFSWAQRTAGQIVSSTGHILGATATKTADMLDPNVDSEMMVEIGERKVLEIRKHWMASSWALIRLAFATTLLILSFAWSPIHWYGWIPWYALIWFVIVLSVRSVWRVTEHYRDRFVITNQRLLRVDGVVGSDTAMIPMRRITDITVIQSWLGRIFNYGHMVFESAGQVQGLNEIRFVHDPKKRKRTLLMAMNGQNPEAMVTNPAEGNPDDGT